MQEIPDQQLVYIVDPATMGIYYTVVHKKWHLTFVHIFANY